MILSFFANPRANLTALIHASVPEFTNLILSIFGTIETANAAICVSNSVGIPKEVPSLAFSITACTTGSKACPRIIGPQELI